MGIRGGQLRSIAFIIILISSTGLQARGKAAAQAGHFLPRVWSIAAADAPTDEQSASIQMDASGDLHMALGGDALYYASLDAGGNWIFETVDDTAGAGFSPSLAFDSQGNPHIAYSAGYPDQTRYASWNGVKWMIQVVSSTQWQPSMSSLVMDASDHPHIVMANSGGIRYGRWTGSEWSVQTLNSCPLESPDAAYPSIVAAPDGALHISYVCYGSGLWYVQGDGTTWNAASVDSFSETPGPTSIALDSQGQAHIAYRAGSAVKYVSWDAGTNNWSAAEVVEASAYYGNAALSIDPGDVPHLAYAGAGGALVRAAFNGTAWDIQSVAGTANLCGTNTQALDASGKAHVAYLTCSPAAQQFHYLHEEVAGWSTPQSVQAASRAGAQASMVIDASGNLHISHYDQRQYQVRYTTWNGAEWTTEVVDSISPGLHVYTSIQVDGGGTPHISYFDNNGHLMYAARTGGTWTTAAVPGAAGQYDALALDPVTGYPGIAYCSGGLKYISWDGSAWSAPESADSHCGGGDMGGENSLAIDDAGNPHIKFQYYDTAADLSRIAHATRDAPGIWSTQEIASGIVRGGSLVLDSQGRPHVPYARYDYGTPEITIEHARLDGSVWTAETVAVFPDHGFRWVTMALDAADVPGFAYARAGDNANPTGYIGWDGAAWVKQEFDTNTSLDGLAYTLIAVAPDGRPWIAYTDAASGDLMVARGEMGETISGTARLGGVTINYTDDGPKSVTTDSQGKYSFIVTDNWTGTITPSKPGCTFAPAHVSLDSVTSNQTVPAFAVKCTVSYTSDPAQDGWIAESSETSNKGGQRNNADARIFFGDWAHANEQVKGILSFKTGALPDNAVLTSAKLKFKKSSIWGTSPFKTHGLLLVDVRKGGFNGSAALQSADFQAAPSKSALVSITNNPVNGWYSKGLGTGNLMYINKTGVTQFRLRFALDDNNDGNTDMLELYSGEAEAGNRPVLTIQFHIP